MLSLDSANISITGQGGTGASSAGIATSGSVFVTSSTGNIELIGTGGGDPSAGITITVGTTVGASSTGTLTLTGTDTGGTTGAPGINISYSTIGNATATGEITLNTDLLTFTANPTIIGTGNLTIQPVAPGQDISVGGTNEPSVLA